MRSEELKASAVLLLVIGHWSLGSFFGAFLKLKNISVAEQRKPKLLTPHYSLFTSIKRNF